MDAQLRAFVARKRAAFEVWRKTMSAVSTIVAVARGSLSFASVNPVQRCAGCKDGQEP